MATSQALVVDHPEVGRCHLCQDRQARISYCEACGHWFCAECRERWFWRGIEFLKQLIGGRVEGCCGPWRVN